MPKAFSMSLLSFCPGNGLIRCSFSVKAVSSTMTKAISPKWAAPGRVVLGGMSNMLFSIPLPKFDPAYTPLVLPRYLGSLTCSQHPQWKKSSGNYSTDFQTVVVPGCSHAPCLLLLGNLGNSTISEALYHLLPSVLCRWGRNLSTITFSVAVHTELTTVV